MNRTALTWLAFAGLLLFSINIAAVEEAEYTVVVDEEPFQLRDYAPQVLAEVHVPGSLEQAGSAAFKPLFGYISGDNAAEEKIAMTAPVGQQRTGERIPMAAPVTQQQRGERWAVSFMMPGVRDIDSLPVPRDEAISLRSVAARRMAVVRYGGHWSEARYQRFRGELEAWMAERKLAATGPVLWARYNAPFVPWFMRRNEIQIPVAAGAMPAN